MALWLVRAGSRGERESLALEEGLAVVGWGDLEDLSGIQDREALLEELERRYPGEKKKTLLNWRGQLWPFLREAKAGDLIAMPLKIRPTIALGEIDGPYEYRPDLPPDARHTRRVKWIKELPRGVFDQDLRYSLGAFLTFCRIQRNQAEERVRALLKDEKVARSETTPDEVGILLDLEEEAENRIYEYINRKYKGHRLAELVAAVLEAQGYKVHVSPEGADGGVDILAGFGPLGFDRPCLAVQVKSGDQPSDDRDIRELQGVMKRFRTEQGLFVSWAGFKSSVTRRAAELFFDLRLWKATDLIKAIQENYDKLSDSVQAELPLKRIWVLVPSEE